MQMWNGFFYSEQLSNYIQRTTHFVAILVHYCRTSIKIKNKMSWNLEFFILNRLNKMWVIQWNHPILSPRIILDKLPKIRYSSCSLFIIIIVFFHFFFFCLTDIIHFHFKITFKILGKTYFRCFYWTCMMISFVLVCIQIYKFNNKVSGNKKKIERTNRNPIRKKRKKNILEVNKDYVAIVKLCCLEFLTYTNNKKENLRKIYYRIL